MFFTVSPPPGIFTPHGTISLVQLIPSLLILIVGLAFWGWMFRDMLDNNDLPTSAKQTWTFVFILLNLFAAVVYYVQEYRPRHPRDRTRR